MKLVTAVLLVASGTAAAGPFVHIQRFDSRSMAGLDVGYLSLDGDSAVDATIMRFDLHAQKFFHAADAGVYFQVPLAYGSYETALGGSESETVLGDLEIGGIYIPSSLSQDGRSLVLHAGLTLPTAPDLDGLNDIGKALIAGYASVARIHDYYLAVPAGVSARIGASPQYTNGLLYVRADIGLDVNLSSSGDETADPALHVNVGVGVHAAPNIAITAELASLTVFDDNDNDDDNIINGGLGVRFIGAVSPYLGVMVPFDDDISDDINFAVIFGLEAAI